MELVRSTYERWFQRAWPAYEKRLARWQADRLLTVSRLLGIPVEQVGWADIVWCHSEHGVPPLEDEAPRFADTPMDGRLWRVVSGG